MKPSAGRKVSIEASKWQLGAECFICEGTRGALSAALDSDKALIRPSYNSSQVGHDGDKSASDATVAGTFIPKKLNKPNLAH